MPANRTTVNTDAAFGPTEWALFVGIALIWGSSFLLIAMALEAMPAGMVTLVRVGLGAAALNLLPAARVRIARVDQARLVLLSVLWVAVPFTLFPLAQRTVNSALTGLLNGATPILVAAVAAAFFGRRIGGRLLVGVGLGFAGMAAISLPSIESGGGQVTGVLLIVGAVVCYGFALNLAAPLQQRYGSIPVMAKMLALATVWTAPYGLSQVDQVRIEVGPWLAAAVLGVVCTGLAFWVMASLLGRAGPTRASFSIYLIPVVSLTLGVAVRGDEVAPVALLGILAVLAGAALASRAPTGTGADPAPDPAPSPAATAPPPRRPPAIR